MRCLLFLAVVAMAGAAQAQELGRLFFTPEQRASLDARRRARLPEKPAAAAASPVTRLDGFVKRSGGPSTVWVDGEALPASGPDDARILERREAPSVAMPVGEGRGRVILKPGQSFDRESGQMHDAIGDGEIQIRRSP